MSHQTSMTNYINAFIQGLVDAGVSQAVISPGSRSTPVSILLHQRQDIKTYIDVDERSAGFFALGLSKASNKPVALVCTSGTAAANYLPAISEAKQANVSLVVITTDRPHELREIGAPQTMNQINLYGTQVKKSVDLALPEDTTEMIQYAYTQGAKLSTVSTIAPKGPVHINIPLREPLLPNLSLDVPSIKKVSTILGENQISQESILDLSKQWSKKKGLIIVGPSFDKQAVALLIELAELLGWPILADPLANVRTSGIHSRTISPYYDTYLRYASEDIKPEVIVRFGKSPVSKPLNQWLAKTQSDYYLVEPSTEWLDSSKSMTTLIVAKEVALLRGILNCSLEATSPQWLEKFTRLDELVLSVIKKQDKTILSEANVTQAVFDTMKMTNQLFVSNSMPIRDLNTYLPMTQETFSIYGNRGVNGIDGITSTALGMAANDTANHTTLLVGDLACFHDMTGLAMAKNYQLPVTIIVVNNNGGGIFSMLSQKDLPQKVFDDLFATSLEINFEEMANMYDIPYLSIESVNELKNVLNNQPNYPRLIEVKTNREENARLRQEFQQEVQSMIECEMI